jgi:predicted Ser/Thr protein kinase
MESSVGDVVVTGAGRRREPPPTPEEIQRDFPQLEVLELIGQGGMGAVYRARQRTLDRMVALKILSVDAEEQPAFAERDAREAQALASLHHPHIVGVYDSGRAGERYYLMMEHVDGTDLRAMLRADRVAPREALAIVSQVCDALQYAHDAGLVHRDIKPENILVDRQGRVKIADFGLAKLLGRPADAFALTGAHQAMGTPHYMAPEQLERPLEVDHRADIYSLGVVLYELLTGELPLGRFDVPSHKVEVDVRLDEIVLRTLAKDPPRRYQHASDVRTDLDGIASTPGGGASVGAGAEHARPRSRAMLGLAVVLGAITLLLAGTLAFVGSRAENASGAVIAFGPWVLIAGVGAVLAALAAFGMRHLRLPGPSWAWILGGCLVVGPLLLFGGGAFLFALLTPVTLGPESAEPFVYNLWGDDAGTRVAEARGELDDQRAELHEMLATLERASLDDEHGERCVGLDRAAGDDDPERAAERLVALVHDGALSEHEQLHALALAYTLSGPDEVRVRPVLALVVRDDLAAGVRELIRSTLDRWSDDDVRLALQRALD